MGAARRNDDYEILERTSQGVVKIPGLWLFTDEKDWHDTWAELENNGELIVTPQPGPPAVDWKKEAVILASAGEFTTSPSEILLRTFRIHHTAAVLELEVTRPGQLQSLCAPSLLIRFQRKGVKSASGFFRFL